MDVALTDAPPGSPTRYQSALDRLFARTGGAWKLGLERTEALLAALGDPHLRYPVLHVGGTNGKGSVVATIDALLRGAGFRVARYTSPHLVDFRERIVVDGVPITEAEVEAYVDRWLPEIERLGATFFEATTAMAFAHFASAGAEVAVIEVGLGGRLDSTNVVSPRVAAVTSIGLEHTQYLGDTLEQIAGEKAGIFKRGAAAAVGERDASIRALLARRAREAGASPVFVLADEWALRDVAVTAEGTAFTIVDALGGARRLTTPLIGEHQAENAALALAAVELAGEPFARAAKDAATHLAAVRLAGRFQRIGRFVFDVAHNPAGAETLVRALRAVRPRRPIAALLGVLGDKDWRAMMSILATVVDSFVLCAPPTAPASRAWSLDEAAEHAATLGVSAVAEPDFDRALARAQAGAATTLVTGSFHTVGDAMLRLRVDPLAG